MLAHGSASLQLLPVVWIFHISEVPGCHLLQQISSQWGSQKLLQGLVSHELRAQLSIFNLFKLGHIINMAILSKVGKPDNFESCNSLKLSFGRYSRALFEFCWLWIVPWIKLWWHSCSMWDKPGWLNFDSGNFFVRGYLPLIQKDSSTHMHGLAVYVKEGLPFAWDLSLENSADFYICFWLALLYSVSYFFFLYWSPSSSLCMVVESISSNIDEALFFNPSAIVFIFGDFHHNQHSMAYLFCWNR